ncbi:MAG: PAS domain-containing protein [Thermodesulfobacteriota bacterium]|nr:PAS domain-containing protein [Thermodesulfobacteriota bacterium]
MMDNIPLGIYRTTLEGEIVFCNKTFAKMFGFDSRKELTDYKVIKLYQNKKDRGNLIKAIIEKGYVEGFPVPMKKRDGTPIWCAVTSEGVFDGDSIVVFLDGVVIDITREMQEQDTAIRVDDIVNMSKDFIIILDLKGCLIDINRAGADFIGIHKEECIGKPFTELIMPRHQELFHHFLSNIRNDGHEDGILKVRNRNGREHYIEFEGSLLKKGGSPHHIRFSGRDITDRLRRQREQLSKEKLQGVLEMAGGVAHRLNPPLMIINNLLDEVLSDLNSDDRNYQKIVKAYNQIKELNEISKKISEIKKYKAIDYVGGIRIVDIDKAS